MVVVVVAVAAAASILHYHKWPSNHSIVIKASIFYSEIEGVECDSTARLFTDIISFVC